jgi:hypothetical protein
MSLPRYPDWDKRLISFLLERSSAIHKYGSHDCVLFVCDCILVETGVDIVYDWRGGYSSKDEATELLRKRCKRGLWGAIKTKVREFDIPETDALKAMRGDVAMIRYAGEASLGMVNGGQILAVDEIGYQGLPMSLGYKFWHIG